MVGQARLNRRGMVSQVGPSKTDRRVWAETARKYRQPPLRRAPIWLVLKRLRRAHVRRGGHCGLCFSEGMVDHEAAGLTTAMVLARPRPTPFRQTIWDSISPVVPCAPSPRPNLNHMASPLP